MLTDSFNRSTLNEAWVKYGSNPIIATDHGDPFIWYESATYYVFCRDQSNSNIVMYTSTNRTSWIGPTVILSPGTAGAWDDYSMEGPYIVKAGGTYYMFYGGNINSGGSGITWKIGYATASAIGGPYTKYASNPIISRAAKGTNDCSAFYDTAQSPVWQVFCTVGSAGTKDDVGDGNIGRFTASDPTGTWTDQGDVLTGTPGQDEGLSLDGTVLVMPYTPVGATGMVQAVSKNKGATWNAALSGNLITTGAGGQWDDNAIYAPQIINATGVDWYMVYQGIKTSSGLSAIGTATANRLHRWFPTANDAFECAGYLHSITPASLVWNCCQLEYPFTPPYTIACDVQAESQNDSGIVTHGMVLAYNGTLVYSIQINVLAHSIRLVSGTAVTAPDDTAILQTNTSISMSVGNWYSIRARITSTSINLDWYNGTTWTNDALTATGLSLIAARPGPLAYAPTGNLSRWRTFSVGGQIVSVDPGSYIQAGTDITTRVGALTYLRYRR